MAESRSNNKVANSLVALSSAAVLAVYTAGYIRTRPAADRFELQSAKREPAVQPVVRTVASIVEIPSATPTLPAPAPSVRKRETAPTQTPTPTPTPIAPSEPTPAKPEAPAAAAAPAPIDLPAPPPVLAPVAAPVIAPPPPVAAPAPLAPRWKDGTYTGWGTSRHGNIEASVVIEGGRILSATISQCRTRYSCDVIDALPPQVAKRQSPDVDYVSGATQSANAFYYAVTEALSKAK